MIENEMNILENTAFEKPEELVGKTLVFEDPERNRSSDIVIKEIEPLGSGMTSLWVVKAKIEDQKVPGKEIPVALKKYPPAEVVVDYFADSYRNFRLLRELNINTWDTYRINSEHRIALMTLAAKEGQVLLTTNDYKLKGPNAAFFELNPFLRIKNREEFIDLLVDILEKAIKANIILYFDCWGMIFSATEEKGEYSVSPIISDLDSFKRYTFDPGTPDFYTQERICSEIPIQNLQNMFTFLQLAYPGTKEEKTKFTESILKDLTSRIKQ